MTAIVVAVVALFASWTGVLLAWEYHQRERRNLARRLRSDLRRHLIASGFEQRRERLRVVR